MRKQRVLGPTDSRNPIRRPRHGLTADQIDWLLRVQGGRCAGCLRPLGSGEVCVDHDHKLAATHGHPIEVGCPQCVRGLLDSLCNTSIGAARDDSATLRRLAQYLDDAASRQGAA